MSEPSNTSGATRYPTNDELDYERRKALGFPSFVAPINQSKGVVSEVQTQFAVEDNDTTNYLGVTSERMTYANSTEQPLAAEEGVELDREEALVSQPVLVTPKVPVPEVQQTDGGGSTQEPLYTSLSGTRFSAEIAEPTTTEQVPVGETAAVPTEPGADTVEVGVSGGSTGQTVSEAEADTVTVAPEAGPSTAQAAEETPETTPEPSPTPPTPTRRSKASDTTTNDTSKS
jgi:hypothetical protein